MEATLRLRVAFVGLLTLALPLVSSPLAVAWSNGTAGYDSYGTHDWILDKALDGLGHRADWVCVRAALRRVAGLILGADGAT